MEWSALLAAATFTGGYNSAVVVLGATVLGAGAGVTGVFTLLRKRTLIADAVSHATLPGVAATFLLLAWLTGDGRSVPLLLVGGAVTGLLSVLAVRKLAESARLPEDSAIGIVLSTFYGAGIVLLSIVQAQPMGGQAGLQSFLLGSTASLRAGEALAIGLVSLGIVLVVLALLKELRVLAFDPDYAASLGWPVRRLDLIALALMLIVVCLGLTTVGLVLIVALVVVPPATARFWTDSLGRMVALSALFGALASYCGAVLSAVAPNLPTGAMIVLVAFTLFLASVLFAPRRGALALLLRHLAFRRQVRLALARGQGVW